MKKLIFLLFMAFANFVMAQQGGIIPGSNNNPEIEVEGNKIRIKGNGDFVNLPEAEFFGPEKMINGNFATGSDYTTSRASVANGVMTITVPSALNFAYFRQAKTYIVGETYRLTYTIIPTPEAVGRSYTVLDTDHTGSAASNPGGLKQRVIIGENTETITFDFVANAESDFIQFFRRDHNGLAAADHSYSFDNISLKRLVDPGDASSINAGTLSVARLPADVTLSGNIFNGPEQLVRTGADGKIPATIYDAGGSAIENSSFELSTIFPNDNAASYSDLNSIGSWDNNGTNVTVGPGLSGGNAIVLTNVTGDFITSLPLNLENGQTYVVEGFVMCDTFGPFARVIVRGVSGGNVSSGGNRVSPYEYQRFRFEITGTSNAATIELTTNYNAIGAKTYLDKLTIKEK